MTTQEFDIAVTAFVLAYRTGGLKTRDKRTDSAYDEWLEENLDKFEDDDAERDFAQWKGGRERPRDCKDTEEVERLWQEYQKTDRSDGSVATVTHESKRVQNPKSLLSQLWINGNEYISEKLLDFISKSGIIKIQKGFRDDDEPDAWVTVENGQHIPINEEGRAVGGAGGWAKGKDFSKADVGTTEHPSARGSNVPCTGFRDEGSARRHEKHWPEFGFKSREEYEKAGINFIKQPVGGDIDGYMRKEQDGRVAVIRFNRKTGEMGIGFPGKEMKTYYKAKFYNGKVNLKLANKYFNKLKEREAYEEG